MTEIRPPTGLRLRTCTCTCSACGGVWHDFPGGFARQSRPGAPCCGSLYWTERPYDFIEHEVSYA